MKLRIHEERQSITIFHRLFDNLDGLQPQHPIGATCKSTTDFGTCGTGENEKKGKCNALTVVTIFVALKP